jgi:multidrug efflux pump subunit AcrB
MDERAQLGDLQNLYVFSSQGTAKVPLGQVSTISYYMEAQKLRRREHFRTIIAEAYPLLGVLSSEAMRAIRPQLDEFKKTLPRTLILRADATFVSIFRSVIIGRRRVG